MKDKNPKDLTAVACVEEEGDPEEGNSGFHISVLIPCLTTYIIFDFF
jgi:hypothetical protein